MVTRVPTGSKKHTLKYLDVYKLYSRSIKSQPRKRCHCRIPISLRNVNVRGFGSNHLVFLKAHPQHTMGRWESRILGYTHTHVTIHTIDYLEIRNGWEFELRAELWRHHRDEGAN